MVKFTCTLRDNDCLSECPDEYREIAMKWIKWGKYVTIEIDAVQQTAKVLPADYS